MQANVWAGLELRHLVALRSVVQARSFGRAARRLGYTQSAMSQQIAALEAIVGHRLVERSRGQPGLELTEAGRLLLAHANAVIARLEAARADLAAFDQGDGGALRVGTYQSVSTRILPALMRDFSRAWPRVEVHLTEVPNHDLLPLVERGELDLTFEVLPIADGPFEALELLRDPYVLLVAADSPLARRAEPPTPREVAGLPLISFREAREAARLEGFVRGHGIEPRIIFRSDDNGAVQGMVGAGLGAALVPALAVDRRDPSVVALPLGEAVGPRFVCLAWHRDRYRSPAARAFVEAAGRLCRDLGSDQQPIN
ncbi:MAG TPA: LysR family transcriptional regulator [Chloroflexota bacterium]